MHSGKSKPVYLVVRGKGEPISLSKQIVYRNTRLSGILFVTAQNTVLLYPLLQDSVWLNRSIGIYEWSWKHGWDEPCGGFWWSTWPHLFFKDSITILEMLHFSSKLAYLFPSKYTDDATKIWKWLFSFENGRGVLTEENLVSTGLIPELCCNFSSKDLLKKCYSSKQTGTSYNQGLLLSSAAYLYLATEDKHYLDIGLMVLDAVLENYTTSGGMLRDEMRGSRTYSGTCEYNQDPGGDWYSFNGVFMLHLTYFTELLKGKDALPDATMQRIKLLVQRTSDSAWNNSAVWPPFTGVNDACNSDTTKNSKSSSPKFHWWWVKDMEQQVMPPDVSLYFRKTGLKCVRVGNNTPLWKGSVVDENACEEKCVMNNNCSKYLFGLSGGDNCIIWSYNRSDHICNGSDQSFNVGVKRPISYASCKGHCGSDKPLKLEQGVCYCDAACTKHLDCCLDYADECVEEQYLSCKGLCNRVEAQTIKNGGYCWCFAGCYPVFTDNNSIGSCCPDYPQQCLGVKMPACLDARTQGSALNLFLAQMRILSL